MIDVICKDCKWHENQTNITFCVWGKYNLPDWLWEKSSAIQIVDPTYIRECWGYQEEIKYE